MEKIIMKPFHFIAIAATVALLIAIGAPVRASEMDNRIESTANNMYVFKTFLKGDDVTIKSVDGIVTLTGSVSDEPRRLLAEEALASLSNVTSVVNNLVIKGVRTAENSDVELGMNVKSVLFMHRSVNSINLEVSVSGGIVTLRGEAKNLAQKQLVTEYAKDVDGVKDVYNEMKIAQTPDIGGESFGEKIDDASITSQVKTSLLFHRSTRVLKTQVITENGVVTLSGIAKNGEEKELASKLAMDINGVVKVNNQMTIAGPHAN
jgi:hyperosmotically inducible periplasmic protein